MLSSWTKKEHQTTEIPAKFWAKNQLPFGLKKVSDQRRARAWIAKTSRVRVCVAIKSIKDNLHTKADRIHARAGWSGNWIGRTEIRVNTVRVGWVTKKGRQCCNCCWIREAACGGDKLKKWWPFLSFFSRWAGEKKKPNFYLKDQNERRNWWRTKKRKVRKLLRRLFNYVDIFWQFRVFRQDDQQPFS